MLPIKPKLIVELSMNMSDLSKDNILRGSGSSAKDIFSTDLTDNGTGVTQAKSHVRRGVLKKRVQFLPEGCLVNVREIPARSRSTSSRSEDSSANDSNSESDDSSYEEFDSEVNNDDEISTKEAASPLSDTTMTKPATTIIKVAKLPMKRNVKKALSRQNQTTVKGSEALPPASSSSHPQMPVKQISKLCIRARRAIKPDETELNGKKAVANVKKRKSAKKNILSQEKQPNRRQLSAKMAYSQPNAKIVNSYESHNSDRMFVECRFGSARSDKHSTVNKSNTTAVSSTLPFLHSSADVLIDVQDGRVVKTLQSVPVCFQSVDGFICPPYQTSIVHFPQILLNDTNQQLTKLPPVKKGDINRQVFMEHNLKQTYDDKNQMQKSPQAASYSNTRSHAWQMANGNIPIAIESTPCIAQLWDKEYESSERVHTSVFQSSSIARAISSSTVRKL